MKLGEVFELGSRTPTNGLCAISFSSIYSVFAAMRFTDEIPWERGKGHFDLKCPDGQVTFRISRKR